MRCHLFSCPLVRRDGILVAASPSVLIGKKHCLPAGFRPDMAVFLSFVGVPGFVEASVAIGNPALRGEAQLKRSGKPALWGEANS